MAQHVRFVAAHKYYVYVRRRRLLSRCTYIGIITRNMYYKHPRLAFILLYFIIILGLVRRLVVKQALPVTLVQARVITTTRTPNRVIYPTGRRICYLFTSFSGCL